MIKTASTFMAASLPAPKEKSSRLMMAWLGINGQAIRRDAGLPGRHLSDGGPNSACQHGRGGKQSPGFGQVLGPVTHGSAGGKHRRCGQSSFAAKLVTNCRLSELP